MRLIVDLTPHRLNIRLCKTCGFMTGRLPVGALGKNPVGDDAMEVDIVVQGRTKLIRHLTGK